MKQCRRCEQNLPLSSFRTGKTAPRICESCLSKLIGGAVFTMNASEVASFMTRLEVGETLRTIVGGGGNTICSKKAFDKHCKLHAERGEKALGLAERNRKLADKKKGSNARKTHCSRGHDLAIHAKRYLRPDGYWHRQCMACTTFKHMNPTHMPKAELVEKVRAAADSGHRVTMITKRSSASSICDFRQIRAIRRLHPEIAEKIARNSLIAAPGIIRTNLREPTLTGIIAAPADPLFTLADQVISRNLPPHIRSPAVSSLVAALWLKEVTPEDAGQVAKMFVNAAGKEDAVDRRFISLDAPAFRDGSVPLIERISERQGLWI